MLMLFDEVVPVLISVVVHLQIRDLTHEHVIANVTAINIEVIRIIK